MGFSLSGSCGLRDRPALPEACRRCSSLLAALGSGSAIASAGADGGTRAGCNISGLRMGFHPAPDSRLLRVMTARFGPVLRRVLPIFTGFAGTRRGQRVTRLAQLT